MFFKESSLLYGGGPFDKKIKQFTTIYIQMAPIVLLDEQKIPYCFQ